MPTYEMVGRAPGRTCIAASRVEHEALGRAHNQEDLAAPVVEDASAGAEGSFVVVELDDVDRLLGVHVQQTDAACPLAHACTR